MKKLFLLLLCCFSLSHSWSQKATTPEETLEAIRYRKSIKSTSLLKELPARNIGPVVQGGRITDLAVDPRDVKTFYVGYASAGIFKTTNNGQSFEPIFDNLGVIGIGDLALSPANPDVLWAGTGENNSSRSSYAGAGIYKSRDGGISWEHFGLTGTQHISRIIAHPTDVNTAWVAAIGALYTENEDRGVFKTTDGGKSWKKTLFINAQTGIIDLIIDAKNPKRLWAAAWERSRKAWEFDEDGAGSGIYRSEDGGETWAKSMKGFPEGATTGRIGLSSSLSDPNIIYALLDNQEVDKSRIKEDTIAGLTLSDFEGMPMDKFMELNTEKVDSFLSERGFPERYDAEQVKKDLTEGKYTIADIHGYFGDANQALFNTGVKGAEVYRSEDGGKSWKLAQKYDLEGVYYTYGYYFGQIRVAPNDPDRVFITGVPLLKSEDGGGTWSRLDTFKIHVDHHALWMNPADPEHMILGNDGGLYLSYDGGAHFTHINNLAVGQFYTVMVDMAKPYNVYGGLQDNGTLYGSSRTKPNISKNWEKLFGGDGMFIVTDHKDLDLAYVGFQFGNYFRVNKSGGRQYITPNHDIGAEKYRWNWRTPLVASPHNHEILYMGGQFLFRSLNMGADWEKISPDLTTNKKPQVNVPFSTISTISESPEKFGLIWVGTDDGNVQMTPDGGNSWKLVSSSLPSGLWVSHVFASPHDKSIAFVALTGYRNDDFHSYVYKTEDMGGTWQSISGDLPEESVNVIVQDPVNPNLLYCGTDAATWISLDGGNHWNYVHNIPNVASYDMIVHPRENELVVATHGRSMYVLDVKPLQALKNIKKSEVLISFKPKSRAWFKSWNEPRKPYLKFKQPYGRFQYFLTSAQDKPVEILISDKNKKEMVKLSGPSTAGFHQVKWDLRSEVYGGKIVGEGEYGVKFKAGKFETEEVFKLGKKPK